MATLTLEGVRKSYGDVEVVHGIDLDIADGEFAVLVGPSGCGKSTILRMIAGLEDVTHGEIRIDDERVNETPAKDRNLAMVFQDYALYPHMTVAGNIGFGLKMNGVPAPLRAERVAEVARLLQLEPFLDRKPRALSGGQRQRVAMGRALARKARLFLFDEPLSNLDAKLRLEVRTQIKLLHGQLGMTSIFVTHDQTEAMTLADRIICLDAGLIAQVGTPDELYSRPRNLFVASFIGSPPISLLEVDLERVDGGAAARFADGQLLSLPPEASARKELHPGRRVLIGLRPEDLTDSSRGKGFRHPQKLSLDVLVCETLGPDTYLVGNLAGEQIQARCAPGTRSEPGARVQVYADCDKLHFFDPQTRMRL